MNHEQKKGLFSLPLIKEIVNGKEVCWFNKNLESADKGLKRMPLVAADVQEAENRLARFAPYIQKVFPETVTEQGLIESPLKDIPQMQAALSAVVKQKLPGRLLLKCDSHLKIAGSVKARGGIYEVLKHAEDLAIANGLISKAEDYTVFATSKLKMFFQDYEIAVGSTGNLGMSIGIMGAALGFKVTVHMSADAQAWKKELLRSKGVNVIEYAADYSKAVQEGRKLSANDEKSYFIDDENSQSLFLGYAVAAARLNKQLKQCGIEIRKDRPLFVYLPCGVGGAPGGIAFGLKLFYGDNVHVFFAEPTQAPCMLIGCLTGLHEKISVGDLGIDLKTIADGLAVGRPSGFVGKNMINLLSGCYTLTDRHMLDLLHLLAEQEECYIEPSATAGLAGISNITSNIGDKYLLKHGLADHKDKIVHIAWATGGSLVPPEIMQKYCKM